MGKTGLAYYASQIAPDKPHQFETSHGYRIFTSVPICRTGVQEYLGKELKAHPDFDPAWNIGDDDVVKVFRPKDVVTAPETVASFEGNSVLDGHPPADVAIVTIDNEAEYGKGHAQNLRVGPDLEDGATPLLADLHVKDQTLVDKIDNGMRDVSCGYVYSMKRSDDGTLVMTRITGNHVAVVPNGRAGPEVSIRDAASVECSKNRHTPELKGGPMAEVKKEHFWGRMLKLLSATDAAPEDLEKVAKAAKDEDETESEVKREAKEKEKVAKDAEGEKAPEGKGEVELHPKLQEAVDHIAHMRSAVDGIFEHLGVGKKKEGEEETAGDANVLEMTGKEAGETELPKQIGSDSAAFLKAIKPLVAASKDKALIDGFNAQVRAAKASASATDANVYAALAHGCNPHEPAIEVIDPAKYFNGVPYAEGLRRYKEAQKTAKGGK